MATSIYGPSTQEADNPMTDESLDVKVLQARNKLHAGRIRAFLADLQAAADGLDLYVELSGSMEARRQAFDTELSALTARNADARAAADSAEADRDRRVSAALVNATDAEETARRLVADVAALTAQRSTLDNEVTTLRRELATIHARAGAIAS